MGRYGVGLSIAEITLPRMFVSVMELGQQCLPGLMNSLML